MEAVLADLEASTPAALDIHNLGHALDQTRKVFACSQDPVSALSESLHVLRAAWPSRERRPTTATLALFIVLVAIENTPTTHNNDAHRQLDQAWTLLHELQTTTVSQETTVSITSPPVLALGFVLATHPMSQSLRCPASVVFDIVFQFATHVDALTSGTNASRVVEPCRLDTSALVSTPSLRQAVAALLHVVAAAIKNALYSQYDLIAEHASSDGPVRRTASKGEAAPALAAALDSIAAFTTALLSSVSASMIDSAFVSGAVDVLSWSTMPLQGRSFVSKPSTDALLHGLAGRMSTGQANALVAPVKASLHAALPPPRHDVLLGHRLLVYLQFLAHVPRLDIDMLFELALHGVGHSWTPLEQHAHRILRALVLVRPDALASSEMGAVYVRRMVETLSPDSSDGMKELAATMGVVVMRADSALFRLAVLELYDKWTQTRSTTVGALLVELVKVVRAEDLHFTMQVVEKMAWTAPSTMLQTVFDGISGPCSASRRVVLVEWFLQLHAQVAPALPPLQSRL